MTDRTRYLLWLSEVLGPCSNKFLRLMERFVLPEEAYERRQTAEMGSLLSPGEYKRALTLTLSDSDKIIDYCEKAGTQIVCFGEQSYPERLRETTIPPVLLYVDGDVRALSGICIAGVGSRTPTQYGRQAAKFITQPLAAAGVTMVSGLAAGIDTEVHKAALEAKGKTVAVLGTGIDVTYPKQHVEMRGVIEKNGAVISEYPPFTKNAAYMFAYRNRIISGLSRAVIIFEAARRSGTMITAGWALDDGREVFAAPGSIFSDRSEGTNRLLKQGAIPALSASDVLDALGLQRLSPEGAPSGKKKEPPALKGLSAKLYELLSGGELNLDRLVEKAARPSGEVLSELMMLELDGIVEALPGQRFGLI